MRIGIYVDVAMDKEPRGIGFHIINLVNALSRVDRQNEYLLYSREDLFRRVDKSVAWPSSDNFCTRPVRAPQGFVSNHPRLWWNYYLPYVVKRDKLDIFHGPNHFLPRLPDRRSVLTIHDLAFFKMNLYRTEVTALLRQWVKTSCDIAGRVIALSKNTQSDLEELGVEPSRIRLIYGGGNIIADDQIHLERKEEVRRQFDLPERYILFVGTIHPRKNIPLLLHSFAKLKVNHGLPHKLVLAGRADSACDEIQRLIADLNISAETLTIGYVADWQLPLLYKMAELFVLPSRYEGFGMCLVEAMAYGTPVIATDTSCIHEVVDNAGLLVPPGDVDALSKSMLIGLTDNNLREQLISRGKKQAARFTWDHCALETIAIYDEIYDEQRSRQKSPECARAV